MECAYPNFAEIINFHPYHITSFASFADVTVELLKAGIIGQEKLEETEIFNIARYAGLPYTVLKCPRMIYLYKSRYRHRQMIQSLDTKPVSYTHLDLGKNDSVSVRTEKTDMPYKVKGRIIDAVTKKGFAGARVTVHLKQSIVET